MIFVIGGCYQGKLNYVRTNFFLDKTDVTIIDGSNCQLEDLYKADIIRNVHLYLRRHLQYIREKEKELIISELYNRLKKQWIQNSDIIFISNEIGNGIVPIDLFEREYREITGRVCCQIAKEANEVYRVIGGIGIKIK